MADYSQYLVDLDTPQPSGRQGESPRAAFTKYNDFVADVGLQTPTVSNVEPDPTTPYMTWIDTSVSPAMERRRNAANDAWIEIGPVLRPLGTASALDVPSGQTAFGTASAASEQSLATDYAGSTEPTTTWPYMTWADTGNGLLKRRNAANTDWVVEGTLFVRPVKTTGDTMTGQLGVRANDQIGHLTAALRVSTSSTTEGDAIAAIVVEGTGAAILRLPRTDPQNLRVESAPGSPINISAKAATQASHLVPQSQVLGLGQTWQNMTGSRSPGTTYTNSTGKPIAVSIYWNSAVVSQGQIYIDGSARDISSNIQNGSSGTGRTIVPPGSSYSFENTSGATAVAWFELR